MQEDRVQKAARLPSPHFYIVVLWLAFFGMLISLSRIVYQDQKLDRLGRDLNLLRQQNQKEISDLREAQSALLEQDLLRLDQLNKQVTKTNEDVLAQAKTLANRTKSELAKTVEQRHQETIRAITDVRADFRSDANVRASQPNEVQKPATDGSQANGELDFSGRTAEANSPTPPRTLVSEGKEQPAPSGSQKKGFWSKLNPFKGRNKAPKQETASGSSTQ
jgi:hypothetical protein